MFEIIIESYSEYADPVKAVGMKAYMRNQFEFFGIPKPQRLEINKILFKEFLTLDYTTQQSVIKKLWKQPQRELQYFAMEAFYKARKNWDKQADQLLDFMITNKSWWDTVDYIADKCCGYYLQKFPGETKRKVKEWTSHESFWMHRTALLFQLKYKSETDTRLLFELCNRYAGESEFFLRKAIGWVLREYSKTDPGAVRKFIGASKLSPLSVREGSKYI